MKIPAISVIMPTYNRAHLVGRAIRCVLAQTFTDYELIVVDDASQDETEASVKAFNDPRIVYLRHEQNRGASGARNTGIMRARGELITFLDDDDESYPDLLAALVQAFAGASEDVGFGWAGIRRVEQSDEEEKVINELSWPADVSRIKPQVYLTVGTGFGLTVRRTCFDIIGPFDESLPSYEDLDLLIHLGERYNFVVVPDIHIKVYNHSGSQLTDATTRSVNALKQVIHKNFAIIQSNPEAWFMLNDAVAFSYYRLNNNFRARLAFLKMARRIPGRKLMWARFFRRELKNAKVTLKRAFSSGPLAYLR